MLGGEGGAIIYEREAKGFKISVDVGFGKAHT